MVPRPWPVFVACVFLQDSRAAMAEDRADNELSDASCPWILGLLLFFSSTHLCGKISTFTIYNLSRLQSSCSMLALKELDFNCGGKERGGF